MNLFFFMIEEKFITYGLGNFDPEKFEPIKNTKYNIKPKGGLWSSPKNSKFGWKDWCEAERYYKNSGLRNYFEFNLDKSSRVYIIDNFFDLTLIPYKIIDPLYSSLSFGQNFIDYEEMTKDYDAIWLTAKGQWETRLPESDGLFDIDGHSISLYGWDCESLLILNKDIIVNVEYFENK